MVDGNTSSVAALCAWLVGLNVGTVSVGIGDIVDNSNATIGASQTVAADSVAVGVALLVTEGATSGAGLVVTERVLAKIVLAPVLAARAGVDCGRNGGRSEQVAGRSDRDETGEADDELHVV